MRILCPIMTASRHRNLLTKTIRIIHPKGIWLRKIVTAQSCIRNSPRNRESFKLGWRQGQLEGVWRE